MEVMNSKHTIEPAEEDEKVLKQPRFLTKTCEMTENSNFYCPETNSFKSIEMRKVESNEMEITTGLLFALTILNYF
jgi:hypothetical protein